MAATPEDPISQYRNWKEQGESLRTQARRAMEVRFKELLTEAARISADYQADFGSTLKPPPHITAFRIKSAPPKPKASKAAHSGATPSAPAVASLDPKVIALEKKVAAARKKLDSAKEAGTPTKALEDKLYEIEDDLRLARSASI